MSHVRIFKIIICFVPEEYKQESSVSFNTSLQQNLFCTFHNKTLDRAFCDAAMKSDILSSNNPPKDYEILAGLKRQTEAGGTERALALTHSLLGMSSSRPHLFAVKLV